MKIPNLKEGDLIEVMWQDAGTVYPEETWIELEDVDWAEVEITLRSIQSVGYFLNKTDNTVFLCQTYCTQRNGMNIFAIPIHCIQVLEKKEGGVTRK